MIMKSKHNSKQMLLCPPWTWSGSNYGRQQE